MRNTFFLVTALASFNASSDVVIRPTYPGTSVPNLQAPAVVESHGQIYETYPATNVRDWSQPSYSEQGGVIYKNYPGTEVPNLIEGGFAIERE